MRLIITWLVLSACALGQGKLNSTQPSGSYLNLGATTYIPAHSVYASRPGSPVTNQLWIMDDTDCAGTASATPTQCKWSGSVWQATGGSGSGGGTVLATPVAVANGTTSPTTVTFNVAVSDSAQALPSCTLDAGGGSQQYVTYTPSTTTMVYTWPGGGTVGAMHCGAVGNAIGPAGPTGGLSGLTTNKIPKSATSTTVVDSGFTDDGTTISTTEALVAGSISTGGATSACNGTAGCIEQGQGTAPSGLPTTGIQFIAPTSVTSYRRVYAGTGTTGFPLYTFSGTTGTETFVASNGTGNVVLTTSPALVTPTLGAAAATSLLATGIVDGKAPMDVTTGTSATLGGTYKSGYTVNEHATAATAVAYTLPTAAAGLQYCVGNGYNGSAANTGVITLNTSASGQFLIWTDGTLSATGGNTTSGGAGGDFACVVGVDSTHWLFRPSQGTWTKH